MFSTNTVMFLFIKEHHVYNTLLWLKGWMLCPRHDSADETTSDASCSTTCLSPGPAHGVPTPLFNMEAAQSRHDALCAFP